MKIILPIQLDLASKDEQFIQLQQLIDLKRNMLLDKQNKYKKISKQNHFLEEIKNDYSNNSNYIMKQLNSIKHNLDEVIKNNNDIIDNNKNNNNDIIDNNNVVR